MLTFVFFNSIKKEGGGNVLFNDTYNTFYLWLCGVGRMVRTIRIAVLPWYELIFWISSKTPKHEKPTKNPRTHPKYKPKQKPHTENPQQTNNNKKKLIKKNSGLHQAGEYILGLKSSPIFF